MMVPATTHRANEPVSVRVVLHKRTEGARGAVLVSPEGKGAEAALWLPVRQCTLAFADWTVNGFEIYRLTAPRWLLDVKGLLPALPVGRDLFWGGR